MDAQEPMAKPPSLVSLKRADAYAPERVLAAMRACLEPLGGMRAFVQPGQRVWLKPNLLGGFALEKAVTTHPAVVRAAIRLVQEAGGVARIGDCPGLGDLEQAISGSGLAPVLEETGAELLNCDEPHEFEGPGNRVAKRLTLTRALLDADVLITLPKLKTHGQMTFTGALKNQFGLIPGALKSQWHFRLQQPEWLARLIVDVNRTAKPVLAIMDAIVAMEGMGPSGGRPRLLGALLASADLAAMDTLACGLIGQDPERVPTILAARETDFGVTRLPEIIVTGDPWRELQLPDFAKVEHPIDALRLLPLPRPVLEWLRRQWTAVPAIIEGKCVVCGACERGCPVSPPAIQPNAAPAKRVDASRCIRCYCCHEFCPVQAIELRPPWLARRLPLVKVANAAARLLGRLQTRRRTRGG